MTMRGPKNGPTGSAGQSAVKSQFEKLGWGAIPNLEHDLGTDIWLELRDARRFSVSALLGVQVKTGPSYFQEEVSDGGAVTGWWFRDSNNHFDYWLTHRNPHVVVLHCLESGVSHWAKLERDAIVSTGKGRKLFVPSCNIVDAAHLPELFEFALADPIQPQWEGSVWNTENRLGPAMRTRCALLTPRLVAPHPNLGKVELDAIEAIAMLTQGRFHNLNHATFSDGTDDDEVTWHLYRAYRLWLEEGDRSELLTANETAVAEGVRAAAAALAAYASAEAGDYESALQIVDDIILRDEESPVDHAWMHSHRSRYLVELGDFEEANRSAQEVQRVRNNTSDPSAMALVAASTARMFAARGHVIRDLEGVIQDRDTASTWWGRQTIARGLEYRFDREFKDWAQDQSVTITMEDVVFWQLRSAMLVSGLAADEGPWMNAASLFARNQLMSDADDTNIASALDLLRLANDGDEIKLAVPKLLRSGPVDVITTLGSTIDLGGSGTNSIRTDLLAIRTGQDAFTDADRARHLVDLLNLLERLEDAQARFQPRFALETFALDAIASLTPAADDHSQSLIRHMLIDKLPISDQVRATDYATVMSRLDPDLWTSAEIAEVQLRTGGHADLSVAIDKLLAHHDPAHRTGLLDRIRAGDHAALLSFGAVTDLPPDVAEDAIKRLVEQVESQTAEAQRGRFTFGGYNPLGTLTLLSLHHPTAARWDAIETALATPALNGEQLHNAIWYIGRVHEHVPPEVRPRLEPILQQLAQREPQSASFTFFKQRDIRGDAERAFAQLFPNSVSSDHMRRLLSGDAAGRAAGASVLVARGSLDDLTLLALLSRDSDDEVRLTVAVGLANWVARGFADDASVELLTAMLNEPGIRTAQRISLVLTDSDYQGAAKRKLAGLLRNRKSALARSRARSVLAT